MEEKQKGAQEQNRLPGNGVTRRQDFHIIERMALYPVGRQLDRFLEWQSHTSCFNLIHALPEDAFTSAPHLNPPAPGHLHSLQVLLSSLCPWMALFHCLCLLQIFPHYCSTVQPGDSHPTWIHPRQLHNQFLAVAIYYF